MPKQSSDAVMRQIGILIGRGSVAQLTDAQLLERFATRDRDAAEFAFSALVDRHGPMVMRVCRLVLRNEHDAHDAFQATFLVLVRRARTLWVRDSLGPWLSQVAHRVSSSSRTSAVRRQKHEQHAAQLAPCETETSTQPDAEIATLVHVELNRLPEPYRLALVLCDLTGQTHEQAAHQLGWPVGTVKTRLTRGRERLRRQLVRRGFATSAGLTALAHSQTASAGVPQTLRDLTIQLTAHAVGNRLIATSTVLMLTKGALRDMFVISMKKVAATILIVGGITTGAVAMGQQFASPQPKPHPDPNFNPANAMDPTSHLTLLQEHHGRLIREHNSRLQEQEINQIRDEIARLAARLDAYKAQRDRTALEPGISQETLASFKESLKQLSLNSQNLVAKLDQQPKSVVLTNPNTIATHQDILRAYTTLTDNQTKPDRKPADQRLDDLESKVDKILRILSDKPTEKPAARP